MKFFYPYGRPPFELEGNAVWQTMFFEVVNLYPNPATDFLMVERHDNSHERFEIFTANGKKVADGNLDEKITTIPVLNWCKGVYFIKLTGSITAVKQFIIAR